MTETFTGTNQNRTEPSPAAQPAASRAAMQLGADSFAAQLTSDAAGRPVSPADSVRNLVQRIELADQAGLDVFGVGEHHRREYLDSAPAVILGAAAARTRRIRLTSAVTVLSAADPVRVFQNFATLDLLSQGRAEMVVGRGSFTESFPLFGLRFEDYDSLFEEKLDLLLKLRENEFVHWSGKHRPALTGQGVYPRPLQNPLPVWVGVGGTPESFARAGALGLPLMVAIIGGETRRFRPLVDLYREVGRRAGHAPEKLRVGVHALGYVAETTQQAADDFFPGYAKTFTRIGRERGWPPVTRAHFDAVRGHHGAAMVGSPAEVAEKILRHSEELGGISRLTFQMDVAELPQEKLLRAIELLGSQVAPIIRSSH
jgi:probable LLM family oxidoreductase